MVILFLCTLWNSRESGSKTVDDLLDGATPGKVSSSKQYTKPGNFNNALDGFNSLGLDNVTEINTSYGTGYVGYLDDGTKVVVRPGSSSGASTLEIQYNKPVKIRYE